MDNRYVTLLKQWCGRLISLQITGMGESFDGGILCPACKHIHGRCDNAIYPFLFLAARTGDNSYIRAAKRLFDWQTNLLCDDGSVYNDANNPWSGTTVFSASCLCGALTRYGYLLDHATKVKWETRLRGMAEWLCRHLNEDFITNINYQCANAAVMAMTGAYFNHPVYTARARDLLRFALAHFTENGLLYGEGTPIDAVTRRGCRPIDIGYNAEESIPSLVKCAVLLRDEDALAFLRDVLRRQLEFMLPDGAWDNSFGSRNDKWTYWGSRTSDGCAGVYAMLGKDTPVFWEAARRNLDLILSCTTDGLLYGGPDYSSHGENPCVHHSFCHAVAVAEALEHGLTPGGEKGLLPADDPRPSVRYYKELNLYKITRGGFRATVTGYDFDGFAGHVSGGTLSLLWHEAAGPIIAASVAEYRLKEPLNMQLSRKKNAHRSLVPRVQCDIDGGLYASCYDTNALIRCELAKDSVEIHADGQLVSPCGAPVPAAGILCRMFYRIENHSVTIKGRLIGDRFEQAVFVLPVIRNAAVLESETGIAETRDIFFLTGGFLATEYRITPDRDGRFRAVLTVPETK